MLGLNGGFRLRFGKGVAVVHREDLMVGALGAAGQLLHLQRGLEAPPSPSTTPITIGAKP